MPSRTDRWNSPSPRILRPDTDECVGPVGFEIEQFGEIHVVCRFRLQLVNSKLCCGVMAAKRGPKNGMTADHKAKLQVGRTEGKAVREYLEALRANKPKRGRKRTAESVAAQLASVDAELVDADPVKELQLVQKRMDLEAELASMGDTIDMAALEASFVAVAKSYSERNGISYAAWRQVGVEAAVLKSAGISRAANS